MSEVDKPTHTVNTRLTADDYMRFGRYFCTHVYWQPWVHYVVALVIAFNLSGKVTDALVAHGWPLSEPLTYFLIVIVLVVTILKAVGSKKRRLETYVADNLSWTMPKTVELTQNGISVKSRYSCTRSDWEGVEEIVETPELIICFVGSASGYVIPRSSFENEEAAKLFVARARIYHAAAKERAAAVTEAGEVAADPIQVGAA